MAKFDVNSTTDPKLISNLRAKGWTARDAKRAVKVVREQGIRVAAERFGMKQSTFWVHLSGWKPNRKSAPKRKRQEQKGQERTVEPAEVEVLSMTDYVKGLTDHLDSATQRSILAKMRRAAGKRDQLARELEFAQASAEFLAAEEA